MGTFRAPEPKPPAAEIWPGGHQTDFQPNRGPEATDFPDVLEAQKALSVAGRFHGVVNPQNLALGEIAENQLATGGGPSQIAVLAERADIQDRTFLDQRRVRSSSPPPAFYPAHTDILPKSFGVLHNPT